jgi:hypothetical protein
MIRTRRWLPSRRLARRSRGLLLGGVWLRLLTRWRRPGLDRRLAKGTDPVQSDELSLRAGQLGSPGTRVRLARALDEAVQLANGQRRPLFVTRLRRTEIQEHAELLLALADRIRGGEPVGVEGLAIAAGLVGDRSSPMYRSGSSGSLEAALLRARVALERGPRNAGMSFG